MYTVVPYQLQHAGEKTIRMPWSNASHNRFSPSSVLDQQQAIGESRCGNFRCLSGLVTEESCCHCLGINKTMICSKVRNPIGLRMTEAAVLHGCGCFAVSTFGGENQECFEGLHQIGCTIVLL